MITREAIYHVPKGSYCYAYDEDTMHIKLRTKKDDCSQVFLAYGDPYNWVTEEVDGEEVSRWDKVEIPMEKVGTTKLYDYWFVAIQPERKRLRYGFLCKNATDCVFYGDNGILEVENGKSADDNSEYIAFPYMNPVDIFQGPEWVKDTVWYQIFPERFCNGNKENDPEGALPWGSTEPTPSNFFGGDLEGIISKLDYLKELGVTGVYFTPLFVSPSNHKYDTTDYMEIDPSFGTKEVLKKLIEEAHKRGIKVMLDAVYNHAGWTFGPWQDVLKNGEQSKYKDWFYINRFPLFPEGIDPFNMPAHGEGNFRNLGYDTFAYTPFMPKFNTENPEVRQYLLDVSTYYAEEFNIDAWRLDVANEISHDFWIDFRKAVKAVNPDLYIVGEVWHESSAWLRGDQFDSVMNYPLGNAIINFLAKGKINAEEFGDRLIDQMHRYSENINEVMFNLLDSHDTPRLLTQCKNNKDTFKLAYVIQLSQMGSPCIYYGTEIGLDGEHDPGCRKCMIWDEEKQDRKIYNHMQTLLQLRKDYASICRGSLHIIDVDAKNNTITYMKQYNNEKVYYFINNSNQSNSIALPEELVDRNVKDLYKDAELSLGTSLKMEAYDFKIIKL